jgi:hypothetical protein
VWHLFPGATDPEGFIGAEFDQNRIRRQRIVHNILPRLRVLGYEFSRADVLVALHSRHHPNNQFAFRQRRAPGSVDSHYLRAQGANPATMPPKPDF